MTQHRQLEFSTIGPPSMSAHGLSMGTYQMNAQKHLFFSAILGLRFLSATPKRRKESRTSAHRPPPLPTYPSHSSPPSSGSLAPTHPVPYHPINPPSRLHPVIPQPSPSAAGRGRRACKAQRLPAYCSAQISNDPLLWRRLRPCPRFLGLGLGFGGSEMGGGFGWCGVGKRAEPCGKAVHFLDAFLLSGW